MYKNICTKMTVNIKRTGSSEMGCCETDDADTWAQTSQVQIILYARQTTAQYS